MIPSVLCETAFLSNPHQAAELRHEHFRIEIATAIERGILRYLHNYAPSPVQPVVPSYEAEQSGDSVPSQGSSRVANASAVESNVPFRAYRVRNGDTLSGLAAESHVSVHRLMIVNDLHSSRLRIGQRIRIPERSLTKNGGFVRTAFYTVRRGDRLSTIARRQNTTVARLEQLNRLHGSWIRVGQRLRVPDPAHGLRRYIVRAGDTLSRLAAEHGMSTRRLEQVNHLKDTGLQVGEVLLIPAGGTG